MGKLSDFIDRKFGVRTRAVVGPIITVAALADLVVAANPDRLALLIVNMSANNIFLAFDKAVTLTRGIFLAANGGSVSMTVDEDFELVGYAIYAAAVAYPSLIYVLEVEAE